MNMAQIQNLLNMQFELSNINSQFLSCINQTQNMQNTNMSLHFNPLLQISNIAFQMLNLGIRLLNFCNQLTNYLPNSNNMKEKTDSVINQLETISNNLSANKIPFYNVVFQDNVTGKSTTLSWQGNITVKEMINRLVIKQGNDFSEMNNYRFIYNNKTINNGEYINKTVDYFFDPYVVPKIIILK